MSPWPCRPGLTTNLAPAPRCCGSASRRDPPSRPVPGHPLGLGLSGRGPGDASPAGAAREDGGCGSQVPAASASLRCFWLQGGPAPRQRGRASRPQGAARLWAPTPERPSLPRDPPPVLVSGTKGVGVGPWAASARKDPLPPSTPSTLAGVRWPLVGGAWPSCRCWAPPACPPGGGTAGAASPPGPVRPARVCAAGPGPRPGKGNGVGT